MSDKAIEALDAAAEEAIIYQAETQVRLFNEARKRKRLNIVLCGISIISLKYSFDVLEEESEELCPNKVQEQDKEVDDSDYIHVIGHKESLMLLVRTLGLNYHRKPYNTLNAIEKYYAMLCLNSIIDINDDTFIKFLKLDSQAHQALITRFNLRKVIIPQPGKDLKNLYKSAEKLTPQQKYKFYITQSFDLDGDDRKRLIIIAHIYNLLSHKKDDIQRWKTMSECSLIIKIWSNIFETLFEGSIVNLIWGDTLNNSFKVDLRLCLSVEGKNYDISNIEFKKQGKEQRLVKTDACLKAIFTELRLAAPGCYVTSHFGRTIKVPLTDDKAIKFTEDNLEQLLCYKELVVKEAEEMRAILLQDTSNFGSQSSIEEHGFIKETYVISPKSKIFPKLHEDFYKS
ncbi:hypothetical protein PHYBLDRAFT_68687 [Phycomyces blakesleeanus NRRL 1555(-)]|uniref:Uncharacterized protein n=1 Tax=Phycomyces blakesleeanus (strain ATCC 8743b / DSM 1359 / FGSC 10004 / NBRC 33097 / NRRL 1555) TaxID=763407 RepID=A0A167M7N2_PHYB8|nr:hypothetical protein PHYBLDRAFT_68687 [Phycomyces blakesleeanus NRRL 1555(-)]OAD72044.1 hypothetical protein PHYBLDRAFT_68687 [Phycomyces blakesleeanus NRRL 1555(-)]|eukprot:XP_018290084.1 hypothetical protein PHYBLDRAFT_68687 [Phycomyces blakesleeanus NRRL 1555(-)]